MLGSLLDERFFLGFHAPVEKTPNESVAEFVVSIILVAYHFRVLTSESMLAQIVDEIVAQGTDRRDLPVTDR
jgi:Asp-tRNA(Asn)/Glu-tRNA(Gln) amidotransferase B subunit